MVEREWQGETVLLGAKIRAPEDMPLTAIQRHIRRFKEAPVREISAGNFGAITSAGLGREMQFALRLEF